MSEAIVLYLYLALGGVVTALMTLAVVVLIVYGALYIGLALDSNLGRETNREKRPTSEARAFKSVDRYRDKVVVFLVFVALAVSFYPSKEDLKWIVGGALLINGVQNIEGIERVPQNTINALNGFLGSLDKEVNELKGDGGND